MAFPESNIDYGSRRDDAIARNLDLIEYRCLIGEGSTVSRQDIWSEIGTGSDSDENDESVEVFLDDLFTESEERRQWSDGYYPFAVKDFGHVIKKDCDIRELCDLYRFLLLATRGNMKDNAIQKGINATHVFEELSECAAAEYFGPMSQSIMFGTSVQGLNFEQKVNNLIREINVGVGYKNSNRAPMTKQKDSGLDLVCHIPFPDKRKGTLIAFGQCKTGENWSNQYWSMPPDQFCRAWFREQPPEPVVRMFFIADGPGRRQWYDMTNQGGIMFDRFRILSMFKRRPLPAELWEKLRTWLDGWDRIAPRPESSRTS